MILSLQRLSTVIRFLCQLFGFLEQLLPVRKDTKAVQIVEECLVHFPVQCLPAVYGFSPQSLGFDDPTLVMDCLSERPNSGEGANMGIS